MLVAVAVWVAGCLALTPSAQPASAGVDGRTLRALPPSRLVDTRDSGTTVDGEFRDLGPVAPDGVLRFGVAGRGGVPATGAAAVAINVTAVAPSADTFLTVYPSTSGVPTTSNLNATAGQTLANVVLVELGSDGQVAIYNRFGAVDVAVDVLGWFPIGGFSGPEPARYLDTRPAATTFDGSHAGGGSLTGGASRRVLIAGRGGVPADAAAVVLNVTAVAPTHDTYLTVHPAGVARPTASNVNAAKGSTVANMVIVPLADSAVDVFNAHGSTDVVVDLLGYFAAGAPASGVTPTRLADTRIGGPTIDARFSGYRAVHEDSVFNVAIAGRPGIPADAAAVALNVTATGPSAASHLTVYPAGEARPTASNVNFAAGQTVANVVIVPVGNNGQVSIYQRFGDVHVVVDVLAWFPNPTDPPTVFGNAAVLRPDGIEAVEFGAPPSAAIAVLTDLFGSPVSDYTRAFPHAADGDPPPYYFDDDEYAFAHPVGREVCFESEGATCLTFGGDSVEALLFTGWRTRRPFARLFTVGGVAVGSRALDHPGAFEYGPGGCYSSGSGELDDGVRVSLFSIGVPFLSVDEDGTEHPARPPESDVYVTGLDAGAQIAWLFADC
jgi:hypothetical protein